MLESLLQILQDWGYLGAFVASFLAGSIVPFSSEVVFLALYQAGLDPVWLIVWTTLGNTLGGMTCYWVGMLGKMEWIHKYFKASQEKLDKFHRYLQGKGAFMALFTSLPYVGDVIAICLGIMRSNVWMTLIYMFIGKLIRYIVVIYLFAKTLGAIL